MTEASLSALLNIVVVRRDFHRSFLPTRHHKQDTFSQQGLVDTSGRLLFNLSRHPVAQSDWFLATPKAAIAILPVANPCESHHDG